MTQAEFIKRIILKPWVRWAADWDACDCYGLVVMYYRHVLGIELGDVPKTSLAGGIEATDLFSGWREMVEPSLHACGFMSYRGDQPTHCGIYIGGGEVLHSFGSDGIQGHVRVTRVKSMELAYGKIRYYAHHLQ